MARPKAKFEKRTYNVILSQEIYDWLQRRAHRERRSGAAIIREILDQQRAVVEEKE